MSKDVTIPSAGPDFENLLGQEVVIEATQAEDTRTGAQRIEPDHSPRTRPGEGAHVLAPALKVGHELQQEVEQLLYRQAELLDAKQWQAWMDLFDVQGLYWMPVQPEQTEWQGSPSIFAEDKLMMEIRMGRVKHPNAWSQAPMWETNHLVSHVAIEAADNQTMQVRSRFHMMELRRDSVRHFGGSYRHSLVRDASGALRIRLQRVDLLNGQAPFDYVLQIWV